jgi:hypothetical protein
VGLLSASTAVVRLFAQPSTRLDREALARAVTRRAFQEIDDGAAEAGDVRAARAGWVGIHDPLATDLSPADLFFQQYFVVGFRWDRRTVPAKLLWIERRRAEAAARTERGLDRLGAAVRRQIKQEVEARLILRALPAPRLFDCVWNLETGRLYFTGKLRPAREAFTQLFRETFGVAPVPLIPYLAAEHVGLGTEAVAAVRAVEPSALVVPVEPSDPADGVPRLPLRNGEEAHV